ncbi:MAG TPA: oligopeptide transporter, OPT family [Opitutaceae bacterium]|nr:oligopeptide transporter, OPT family [Opitutaceae bacterium]
MKPYVSPQARLREFTVRAVITGTLLGMVFGASSLYLVLKVGLTVSASIPVAVISLALFRALSRAGVRDATVLENNISQTAGSAGESIAFGVGVTMPAILILGYDLQVTRVLLVGILGSLLGILMMIPLRQALIVKEHGILKYPEGTACATVLMAGDARGSSPGGPVIFAGFLIGLAYKAANIALRGWRDVAEKVFGRPFESASVSIEVAPELLGVGYIIGPKIASLMCGGGVLAYLVLIPMIKFFGSGLTAPLAPATMKISAMGPDDIHRDYILFIGAGAVAAGGIVSLIRALPTIWRGLRSGLKDLGLARGAERGAAPRTEQDLPMRFVAIGTVLLLAAIVAAPALRMNLLGAVLIVIFGFLFVTVSSRLTGEIGSSSNPISGMTVATLLLTCLVFLLIGWTGSGYYITALSVGAIVCIASSNAGATSQDLKTGYLLGATPKYQQIAILIGAAASAACMGPILTRLNDAYTVYVPAAQVAPAGLVAPPGQIGPPERVRGEQAGSDPHLYHAWEKTGLAGGPEGKYLVDGAGRAVWYVDPGINGTHWVRPDGSRVLMKFSAPKATLMSYLIKGILGRQMPWALVLFGVTIAATLEILGLPSLAFAVGLYLPLSSSTPIWAGGLIRWAIDHRRRRRPGAAALTPEEQAAESDKSPGVLLASGYIAGGAIAGIIIAFLAGALDRTDARLEAWADAHNPFFNGPWSNALSLLPFALIAGLLYRAGCATLKPPPDAPR